MTYCRRYLHLQYGNSKFAIALAPSNEKIRQNLLTLLILASNCSGKTNMANIRNADANSGSHSRHIQLEGQPNFRDIGGYKTKDRRTVKWLQVFRSGELPQLTDEDLVKIESLGVRAIVNFLTESEIAFHGKDRIPKGVRQIAIQMETGNIGKFTNVILEARKTGDFSTVPAKTNSDIHRFLIDEGREYFARFLREVADPENRPLIFHCSHGIHRTGTATAILLSALGVPWGVIRNDYLLSNELRKEQVKMRVEQLKTLCARNRGIPVEEVDPSNIEAFYILDGSYIDASLNAAIQAFGSMHAYIRHGLGLSQGEILCLRGELLND